VHKGSFQKYAHQFSRMSVRPSVTTEEQIFIKFNIKDRSTIEPTNSIYFLSMSITKWISEC
jgi:hypothetical protein